MSLPHRVCGLDEKSPYMMIIIVLKRAGYHFLQAITCYSI